MSQSKSRLFVIVLAFVVLAMSSLACNESEDVSAASSVAPTPWSKQDMMASAYEQGRAVFVYYGNGEGLALCIGTKRAASLKEPGKEYMFGFDSGEALNLSLCRRNPDTGNYAPLQNISGVNPGDYLSWDSNLSLAWTHH